MSDKKPLYTEDGVTFRAGAIRGDAWGTVPPRSAQDSAHQQTKAALRSTSDFLSGGLDLCVTLDWEAMLDEARVKVLARRIAELEAENHRLAALLADAENRAAPSESTPVEFPLRALRGGNGVPR